MEFNFNAKPHYTAMSATVPTHSQPMFTPQVDLKPKEKLSDQIKDVGVGVGKVGIPELDILKPSNSIVLYGSFNNIISFINKYFLLHHIHHELASPIVKSSVEWNCQIEWNLLNLVFKFYLVESTPDESSIYIVRTSGSHEIFLEIYRSFSTYSQMTITSTIIPRYQCYESSSCSQYLSIDISPNPVIPDNEVELAIKDLLVWVKINPREVYTSCIFLAFQRNNQKYKISMLNSLYDILLDQLCTSEMLSFLFQLISILLTEQNSRYSFLQADATFASFLYSVDPKFYSLNDSEDIEILKILSNVKSFIETIANSNPDEVSNKSMNDNGVGKFNLTQLLNGFSDVNSNISEIYPNNFQNRILNHLNSNMNHASRYDIERANDMLKMLNLIGNV